MSRAKINLTLEITGIREDGYHLLDSVMQKIDLHDTLRIDENRETTNHRVFCDAVGCPEHQSNIVYKTLVMWSEQTGSTRLYDVTIEKRIPLEAGLGGGSSNAAAVLRYLNQRAEENGERFLSDEALSSLAATIGADVPFCLTGVTARCRGIGDLINPLEPLPTLPTLLLLGQTPVNTKAAFAQLDAMTKNTSSTFDHEAIVGHLRGNEKTRGLAKTNAFLLTRDDANQIEKLVNEIPTIYAGLSGSGPTYFLIFSDASDRAKGEALLRRHVASERIVATTLAHDV